MEERLTCAICLELFEEPVTVSCGHTFCSRCIRDTFQRQAPGGSYHCPTCRSAFPGSPLPLRRSVTLREVVEEWRRGRGEGGGQTRPPSRGPEPESVARCPSHGAALDLYCRQHRLEVCSACAVTQHRGHDLAILGEEKLLHEKKLIARYEEIERQSRSTDRMTTEIKEWVEAIKDTASLAKANYANKLESLARALAEAGEEVMALIEREERTALSQADGFLQKLEERQAGLSHGKQQLEATLQSTDALQIIQFSQETNTLKAVGEEPVWVPCDLALDAKLGGVTKALEAISKLIHGDLRGAEPAEEIPGLEVAEFEKLRVRAPRTLPNDLQVRGKLLHSYCKLTFDANTAHRFLTVSKGGRRVSHQQTQLYPPHPERFESDWQVLCKQSLVQGQHYWEMKLSDQWVFVGIAYKTIERKGASLIGRDGVSWAVQLFSQSYSAWHNGNETKLSPAQYRRVGVFLDCAAGNVSFYGITDTMTLIHRFDAVFVEPLYPALWVGDGVTVSLTQLN